MPVGTVEALLTAGRYLQARREAERMLLEGGLTVAEQGRLNLLACRACLGLEELFAAAKFGERAVERAREAHDLPTLGRAHLELGCAYARIGDGPPAEEHLLAFLALLPDLPEAAELEGPAYRALAAVHKQRREWLRAVERLERAAWLFGQQGREAERAQVALEAAWCHLMLEQPDVADPHLMAVEAYLLGHDDERLAADLLCIRALWCRLRGDLKTSAELCQEVFVPGRPGVDDRHLGQAAWIMGENALSLGRFEEAGIFVNLALTHAANAGWPTLMNLACDLRRRIASGQLDE